ncbi:hypothetical protein LCGC14_1968770 [marine sediment metagenome]|uniref:Uncharacterized protein n=1 Tax=marine sediment metagenome TaxID=412755 RepID=A0A0F9G0L8_9ZZZZ
MLNRLAKILGRHPVPGMAAVYALAFLDEEAYAARARSDDRHLHRRVGARRRELEAKWGKLPAVSGIDPWTVETEQEARARAGSF